VVGYFEYLLRKSASGYSTNRRNECFQNLFVLKLAENREIGGITSWATVCAVSQNYVEVPSCACPVFSAAPLLNPCALVAAPGLLPLNVWLAFCIS
jgi:hypothetical protein